jgi:hypothetical protein
MDQAWEGTESLRSEMDQQNSLKGDLPRTGFDVGWSQTLCPACIPGPKIAWDEQCPRPYGAALGCGSQIVKARKDAGHGPLVRFVIRYRTESKRLEFIGVSRYRNALPGVCCELLREPLDLRRTCSADQGFAGTKPGTFPPSQNVSDSTRARLVIEVGHR